MTAKTKAGTKAAKPLHVDAESRALMANPAFREALAAAKRTPPGELLTLDELDAELHLSDADKADAQAWLDQLEGHEATEETGGFRRAGQPVAFAVIDVQTITRVFVEDAVKRHLVGHLSCPYVFPLLVEPAVT